MNIINAREPIDSQYMTDYTHLLLHQFKCLELEFKD